MALEPGILLNERYRVEKVIAQGGMGAIYRAVDTSLGVAVAIKENLFQAEVSIRQFRREATILAGLRHPNLPRVTDHFILPEKGQYLVMDFIEGEDLHQRIRCLGTVSEDEVIRIGAAVCEALSYLHSRPSPVMHRDIKPGNIKITPTGQVFLVDFGLAKIEQSGMATTTGAQALTPGYAPPEQYGTGTEQRSDIYSLGATLYTALTGQIPEDGLARAMRTSDLTPIRKHNPFVSERTVAVIERALAVQAKERYADAAAFRNALLNTPQVISSSQNEDLQTDSVDHGVQERPANPDQGLDQGLLAEANVSETPAVPVNRTMLVSKQPGQVGSQGAAKKKNFPATLAIFAAAGIIILCAASAFLFTRWSGWQLAAGLPAAANTQAPLPTNMMEALTENGTEIVPAAVVLDTSTPTPKDPPPTEAPALEESATPVSTLTGGGTGWIVFASDRSGIPQVWLMRPDGSDQTQLTQFADGACQPAWSPDGSQIVVVSPCRKREDVYKGSSLFIINKDGTGLIPLISVPGGDFEPAWSPDGSAIAFTSLREGIPHIYLYTIADGTTIRLSSVSSNDRHPAWAPDGTLIAFDTTRLSVNQIWTMNPDGSQPREFSQLENGAGMMPAWSPKGDVLVYARGADMPEMTARAISPANAPEVRVSDFRPALEPEYAPDGYWVVFTSTQNGNIDLYRMTLAGGTLTRLTDAAGADWGPAWMP